MKAELRRVDPVSDEHTTHDVYVDRVKVGRIEPFPQENGSVSYMAVLETGIFMHSTMISHGATPKLAIRAAIKGARQDAVDLNSAAARLEFQIFGEQG